MYSGPTTPPWVQPYPGRARPTSNTGPIVATVVIAALVVTAGLIGVLALTGKKDSVADTGYTYPTSSDAPASSDDAGSIEETTTTTRKTESSSTRTSRTTRTTRTTSTPSGPRPVYALADNPLFGPENGVNASTCTLPTWNSDPQSAANFFTAALPCVEAAWLPAMQRAGLPYATPGLEFPSGTSWSSPCGSVSGAAAAAFYCPQNSTIYMPFAGLHTEISGAHPGVYFAIFAHEFGHHVENLSGVSTAYWNARYDAGVETEAGLDLSRRMELGAQCFLGMFLAGAQHGGGSVDDNIIREALEDGYTRGDDNDPSLPRDHGTKQHYGAWEEQGFLTNRTASCNTWAAAAADVA